VLSGVSRPFSGTQPELTPRAVMIGLAIGCVVCFTNLSLGLQSGWISMWAALFRPFLLAKLTLTPQDVRSVCTNWFPYFPNAKDTTDTPRDHRCPDDICRNWNYAFGRRFCWYHTSSRIALGGKRWDTTHSFVLACSCRMVMFNSLFWVRSEPPF